MARKLTSRPGQIHRVLAPRTNAQHAPLPPHNIPTKAPRPRSHVPTECPRSNPAHGISKAPRQRIVTKAPRNLPTFGSYQHLLAVVNNGGPANYHGMVKLPPPRRNPVRKVRKDTRETVQAFGLHEIQKVFGMQYQHQYYESDTDCEDFEDFQDSSDSETDEDEQEYMACEYFFL